MAKRSKMLLFVFGALVIAIAGLLVSYRTHYGMERAHSFEVGSASSPQRVLIATQGSAYKDALVAKIIEALTSLHAYVKVVDVTALPTIHDDEWKAVVLIHTWEMGHSEENARVFIDRVADKKKLIVLTTSGGGNEKPPDVDAISSASKVEDIPQRAQEIAERLTRLLEPSH